MEIGFVEYLNVQVMLTCLLFGYIIKNYTKINNKRIPLIMIILGTLVDVVITFQNDNPVVFYTLIEGALAGLASCGLYDFFTKSIGVNKEVAREESTSSTEITEEITEEYTEEIIEEYFEDDEDVLSEVNEDIVEEKPKNIFIRFFRKLFKRK